MNSQIKTIIAPHEISEKKIKELQNIFKNSCIRLSCLRKEEDFQKILIIDSIGQLRYIIDMHTSHMLAVVFIKIVFIIF